MNQPQREPDERAPAPEEPEARDPVELSGELNAPPGDDLRDWLLDLERWGDEACVVAALGAGRLLGERGVRGPEVPTPEALAAAEFLLRFPSRDAEREAHKVWLGEVGSGAQVEWAEVAAEVGWRAQHELGLEATWERLRAVLRAWIERRSES
ncbi:MAG TPA: hypothetical protein DEA08_34120 [Planctomycetes bacterium]|nr:hypothetical protein [Planctomycetota bacterium]